MRKVDKQIRDNLWIKEIAVKHGVSQEHMGHILDVLKYFKICVKLGSSKAGGSKRNLWELKFDNYHYMNEGKDFFNALGQLKNHGSPLRWSISPELSSQGVSVGETIQALAGNHIDSYFWGLQMVLIICISLNLHHY